MILCAWFLIGRLAYWSVICLVLWHYGLSFENLFPFTILTRNFTFLPSTAVCILINTRIDYIALRITLSHSFEVFIKDDWVVHHSAWWAHYLIWPAAIVQSLWLILSNQLDVPFTVLDHREFVTFWLLEYPSQFLFGILEIPQILQIPIRFPVLLVLSWVWWRLIVASAFWTHDKCFDWGLFITDSIWSQIRGRNYLRYSEWGVFVICNDWVGKDLPYV